MRLRRVGLLGIADQTGGKFHLRLNTGGRPIANKYREGKMQRTLKRELKGPETGKREPNGRSGDGRVFSAGLLAGVLVRVRRSAWVGAWESFMGRSSDQSRVQAAPETFGDEILPFTPS